MVFSKQTIALSLAALGVTKAMEDGGITPGGDFIPQTHMAYDAETQAEMDAYRAMVRGDSVKHLAKVARAEPQKRMYEAKGDINCMNTEDNPAYCNDWTIPEAQWDAAVEAARIRQKQVSASRAEPQKRTYDSGDIDSINSNRSSTPGNERDTDSYAQQPSYQTDRAAGFRKLQVPEFLDEMPSGNDLLSCNEATLTSADFMYEPENDKKRGHPWDAFVAGVVGAGAAYGTTRVVKSAFWNNETVTTAIDNPTKYINETAEGNLDFTEDLHDVMFRNNDITFGENADFATLDAGVAANVMSGAFIIAITLVLVMYFARPESSNWQTWVYVAAFVVPLVSGGLSTAGFIMQNHGHLTPEGCAAFIWIGAAFMGVAFLTAMGFAMYRWCAKPKPAF